MQNTTPGHVHHDRRDAHPRSRVVFWAGVLAVAGTAATGCVSTARYTDLQRERDLLQAKNDTLRNDVENANKSGAELAQEKSALEAQLANSQNQQEALNAKVQESEEDKAKMQATYDGLVKSMQKELKSGQIEVTQLRDGLRVNVSQDILFDSGSAALDKNGTEVLGRVAAQLKKSGHQILVIGHTDNKPVSASLSKRYPSNWELAGARASSVVRLFAQSGLPSKRMLAVSVADSQPVASNKSEEGRAKNRRIEIRLRPNAPDEKNS